MALKIVAVCLSSFAVGWSCCSIVYQVLLLRKESHKSNNKTGNAD